MNHKILIATSNDAADCLGGPERFAPQLFSGLCKRSPMQYFGYFNSPVILDSEITFSGCHRSAVSRAKFGSVKSLLFNITAFKKLWTNARAVAGVIQHIIKSMTKKRLLTEFIEKNEISIVHIHDYDMVCRLKKSDRIIIYTNHFKGSFYKECAQFNPGMNCLVWKWYFLKRERSAIKRSSQVTFPSISAMQLLQEDFPDLSAEIASKSKIVYSGISSISQKWKNTNEHVIVLNIGNHIPDKGVDLAIRLFDKIFGANKNVRFVNVGMKTTQTIALEELIEKCGLNDRVLLKGVVPFEQVKEMMSEATLMFHTPRRVVFDLSLLEAMSAGIPVLASNVLGNREALGENHPLYINVNKDGSIDTLFERAILADRDYLASISAKELERFNAEFTMTSMLDRYEKLYECY